MKIKNQPATIDGTIKGIRISLNRLSHPAPETCAASSSDGLIWEKAETTVRIPKGMYTVVCKDGEINEQSVDKIFGSRVMVSPQTALILHD